MVTNKIRVYIYAVILGIFFVFIIPFICTILHISMNTAIIPPVISGYIVYVLLGYILDNVQINRRFRIIIYILGFIGWLLHFGGTLILSRGKAEINGTFKGYLNFPCLFQSVAVFVFIKYIDYKKVLGLLYERFSIIIYNLSSLTFGVYLTHFYLILWIPLYFNIDERCLEWRIIGALFIFTICSLVTYILHKIPLLNHLVP